jgi:hypothetical protein
VVNCNAASAAAAARLLPTETTDARKVKGSPLLGLASIWLASACGARSALLAAEEADSGAQQDAAVLVGFSDSDQPAPIGSVVGGSPDSAVTGPMQAGAPAPPIALDAAAPSIVLDAASMPIVLDAASTACTHWGGASSDGDGRCGVAFGELCGDINYQASCQCPRGSCVCFGPTTHVVSYAFCPSCGIPVPGGPNRPPSLDPMRDQVLALCGFPH